VSRKIDEMIESSPELCSRSAELHAMTKHLVAEARETIRASEALIDRINRPIVGKHGANRT